MRSVVIDCDPGHDDAMAIMTAIAHPEELNILGISTIGGNQTLGKVTRNAQRLLSFLHVNLPLASGHDKPLVKKLRTAPEAHGDSGMDGATFSEEDYPIASTDAVEFLYQKIRESPDPVTVIATGPLTNIALLVASHPDIVSHISEISLMGGGISHGNVTPLAEFNVYVDPEAADIVFQSGVPIVMSGLDVTERAQITVDEIKQLKGRGKVSQLAFDLLSFYNKSGHQFGFVDSPVHDLCAVAYLLNSEIFKGTRADVHVITDEGASRGLTYADFRLTAGDPKPTLILQHVERAKFAKLLMDSLSILDRRYKGV